MFGFGKKIKTFQSSLSFSGNELADKITKIVKDAREDKFPIATELKVMVGMLELFIKDHEALTFILHRINQNLDGKVEGNKRQEVMKIIEEFKSVFEMIDQVTKRIEERKNNVSVKSESVETKIPVVKKRRPHTKLTPAARQEIMMSTGPAIEMVRKYGVTKGTVYSMRNKGKKIYADNRN